MWIIWAAAGALGAEGDEEDKKRVYDFSSVEIMGELVAPDGTLAATPGGAQDIAYFRDRVMAGEVPLPEAFTPEGLFSEHDLPLDAKPCSRLLCTNVAGVAANLIAQPQVVALAQLGFDTGLRADTFRRAPLNLVAVIDKSCSMSGEPIETVKASLRTIVSRLRPDDQLSLVLYGSTVHTQLPPTQAKNRDQLLGAIDAVAIRGSTNMEAGLTAGFALAAASRRTFDGATRVMLFTDERPNTGRTDPESFMGLAERMSQEGIGMTTVGVSVHFGAELAQQVSAVRGGNLVYFATAEDMLERLPQDFDLLVTELAYDLDVRVKPAPGFRIAGLYGVPGSLVTWDADGAVRFRVSTIFLSKKKGAIYVAVAGDDEVGPGDDVMSIALSYTPRDGEREIETRHAVLVSSDEAPAGLLRGRMLVDEATALSAASVSLHHDNDPASAYRLVHALSERLRGTADPTLDRERALVSELDRTLAAMSGRPAPRDLVTGLPH